MSSKEVVDAVQLGTRRYAKRQITWFRHQTVAERIDLGENFNQNFEKIAQSLISE